MAFKYERVRDGLLGRIRDGDLPGERPIPAERLLAEEYGVSYMTARRAVAQLVDDGLLERRGPLGTFVRGDAHLQLSDELVHLILPDLDNALSRDFLRSGLSLAAARGWQPEVIRRTNGDDRSVQRALGTGRPCLIMADRFPFSPALVRALQEAANRVAVVGTRLDMLGIPSVLADDALAVNLAVSHLRQYGHERIAMVIDDNQRDVTAVQVSSWSACLAGRPEAERWLVAVRSEQYAGIAEETYRAVSVFLTGPGAEATALLCMNEEMALAAMAACRDSGRPVPAAMALVNLYDSPLLALANPNITTIDVQLTAHLTAAYQLLDDAADGCGRSSGLLRLIQPVLLARESVADVPSNGAA